MMRIAFPLVRAVAVLVCGLTASPARAQPLRVFVAAQGSDTNPCTFAAPCRTFQHGHDVVTAGGEIDVLDPAGYGKLVISKGISIQGHGFAGIGAAGSGDTAIAIAAGPSDVINLEGLLIDGIGTGQSGITFATGGWLTIDNCIVRNFASSGIGLAPRATAQFAISNTLVADNGLHGIFLQPSGAATHGIAVFDRVRVFHNAGEGIGIYGNFVDNSGSVGGLVTDSVAAYNSHGFYALGGTSAGTFLTVHRSVTMNNRTAGVFGDGPFTSVLVSQSNMNYDFWGQAGGACVTSYGDNYTNNFTPPCSTIARQ